MTSSRVLSGQRAFTLIEILVVIGIMAVVTTMVGIGLSRGGEGEALTASQSLLVAQLNAARAQAASGESRTALVVVADASSPERDQRFLAVAVEDNGMWRAITDGTMLPRGILVRDNPAPNALLKQSLAVALDPGNATTRCLAVLFEAWRQLATRGGGEIWLGVGVRNEQGWSIDHEAPARVILVSRYGAVTGLEATP
jgi:prepilin-type N-terminal cleavage/methylation domain-containing protein